MNLISLAFLAASLPAFRYYYKNRNIDALTWVILADLWAGSAMILP